MFVKFIMYHAMHSKSAVLGSYNGRKSSQVRFFADFSRVFVENVSSQMLNLLLLLRTQLIEKLADEEPIKVVALPSFIGFLAARNGFCRR